MNPGDNTFFTKYEDGKYRKDTSANTYELNVKVAADSGNAEILTHDIAFHNVIVLFSENPFPSLKPVHSKLRFSAVFLSLFSQAHIISCS